MSYPSGIPLRDLHVGAYNPRIFVPDDQGWKDFKGSIKAFNGVYTPIIVRPVQGKKTPWEIVAGQRRYFGSLEVLGQDYEIPVNVKELTDEEALKLATSENLDREDMNPAEEAMAAAKLLANNNGDKLLTAKGMGWSPSTLESRLKLMACSDKVREHLIYKKINLGVAEMLSGMTYQDQDAMIIRFEKEGVPTVDDVRALVLAATKSLSAAIFDQAECGACPHNSAKQKSMFENIGTGHCLNAPCFDKKTEQHLTVMADQLKEDFNRVEVIYPSMKFLMQSVNPDRLGQNQVDKCRSCANFGAAVSASPSTLGKVVKSLCFEVPCHDKLAEEHRTSLVAAENAKQKPDPDLVEPQNEGAMGDTPQADNKPAGETNPKSEESQQKAVKLTNAVEEFRDKLYQRIVGSELADNPNTSAQFVLALLMNRQGSYFDGDLLKEQLVKSEKIKIDKPSGALKNAMRAMMTMDRADAEAVLPRLGLVAIGKLTRTELADLTKLSGADLAKHFKLDTDFGREFLKCLTKDQICAVSEELGIKAAMDKTFSSLANGKKDDFIKAVTAVSGFDYMGKVPKVLKPSFGK